MKHYTLKRQWMCLVLVGLLLTFPATLAKYSAQQRYDIEVVISKAWRFGARDEQQVLVVPKTGYYAIMARGAQGGQGSSNFGLMSGGGAGGYAEGYRHLTEGTTLYVTVGTKGADATLLSSGAGGSNGGGGGSTLTGTGLWTGGGGGGATDVRLGGATLNNRILVAGGGGGGGGNNDGGAGGAGGKRPGYNGGDSLFDATRGAYGGTQTGGGRGRDSSDSGTFGRGGDSKGNIFLLRGGGGGGGGGWYGGGGGGGNLLVGGGGGGGGSSYVGGVTPGVPSYLPAPSAGQSGTCTIAYIGTKQPTGIIHHAVAGPARAAGAGNEAGEGLREDTGSAAGQGPAGAQGGSDLPAPPQGPSEAGSSTGESGESAGALPEDALSQAPPPGAVSSGSDCSALPPQDEEGTRPGSSSANLANSHSQAAVQQPQSNAAGG